MPGFCIPKLLKSVHFWKSYKKYFIAFLTRNSVISYTRGQQQQSFVVSYVTVLQTDKKNPHSTWKNKHRGLFVDAQFTPPDQTGQNSFVQ